jgi:hypothetical protein
MPGEARPDWEVFSGLAVVLGLPDPALTSSRADQVIQGSPGPCPRTPA